jgi:nicotinamide mononucleotide transporter
MSPWEIFGTLLGVLGVWLMIRQNVWTWPIGILQVTVSAWVFFQTKLYSDALLQVFFFVIQAYGWWHWLHARGIMRRELPVTRLSGRGVAAWIITGIAATAAWGELMRRTTDAALPYWDAFILMFSIIAQWLQAQKRLENWAGWMIVNVVATGVYWAKDLRLYAGLYLVFSGMAVMGHIAWRRSLPARAATARERTQDANAI